MFKIDLPVNRDGPGRRHRLPRALFSVLLLGKQWFAAGSAIHFAWDGSVVQSLAHAQHACVQILVFIFLSWPTKQAITGPGAEAHFHTSLMNPLAPVTG